MTRDFDPKLSWNSLRDNCIEDFYKPALKNCELYQRLSGYFSSSVFAHIALEILEFVETGGRMELVTSPELSRLDKETFEQSVLEREKLCSSIFLPDLKNDPDNLKFEFSKIMGYMLTNEIDNKPQLEIKIAVPSSGAGIYHQKVGILHYVNGERIAFSGSINETGRGLYDNKENFVSFRSWGDDTNKIGISSHQRDFNNIWNGNEKGIKIFDLPEAVHNQLLEVRAETFEQMQASAKKVKDIIKNQKVTKLTEESEPEESEPEESEPEESEPEESEYKKQPIELRDYQLGARQKWLENDLCGLFEMATGTGKTYTAFGCMNKLQNLHERNAIIIACPQKHLVEQWKKELVIWNNSVQESEKIVMERSITCNSDYPKWRTQFDKILHDYNVSPIGSSSYITNNIVIFTTHSTLGSDDFTQRIQDMKKTKKFLIVDEVHNIGDDASKKTLLEEYSCRLGLSATPSRHMDDIGTGILKDYFHSSTCDAKNNGDADVCDKCKKNLIIYKLDLRTAIHVLHRLCTYEYYPYYVELTLEEMDVYDKLTKQIAQAEAKRKKGIPLTKADKWPYLARGYLVANAENKDKMLDTLLDLEFNNKLSLALIYCTSHPRADAPKDSPKQLERVKNILFEKGIKSDSVTFEDPTKIRGDILSLLEGKVFGCITAVKCLDEGVDIPAVETGIFMASSGNPKQFIQRRGRILRKNKQTGKETAKIYDILVSPPIPPEGVHIDKNDKKLIAKELFRHKEFAEISDNKYEAFAKISDIAKRFEINLDRLNYEYIKNLE
ncbi:MAG: DEAD/DEAH box helicase family protein [Candidatus Nitrosopelagicus sp.]|nr:DEAD/DEAH box helicase family protein [Candidatus Nitrosopelagicus sp.]